MLTADDAVPSDAVVLQDIAGLAEDDNKKESDEAAAERAYVRSLVNR